MTSRVYAGLTRELERQNFQPPVASTYIYGATGAEDRSIVGELWLKQQLARGVSVVSVTSETREYIEVVTDNVTAPQKISLFDQKSIETFLHGLAEPIHIDITAIAFGSWAALIRAGLNAGLHVKVIYVEPRDYLKSASPIGDLKYDLSVRTEGIAPLPGFARLARRRTQGQELFVPLLGFEGNRLARCLEDVQPEAQTTYPVIGLPGFRPEYTFHSIEANVRYLDEQRSTLNIKYARANCPFSVYALLTQLVSFYPRAHLQVAALGTKPHALGAALFAMQHPTQSTILYDHPIRSRRRTSGSGRLCIYDIMEFHRFYVPGETAERE